jgi:YegS/Rv2252/BmrU family lipid kinase
LKHPQATLLLNDSARNDPALTEALARREEAIDIVETDGFAAMEEAARNAVRQGTPRLIVAGGDGAVGGMANILVEEGATTALGVLPFGTGNDFAASLGVRGMAPAEALATALTGEPRAADVIHVGDRCLINVASMGSPAETTTSLSPELKEALGAFAYMLSGLAKAINLQPQAVAVSGPGFDWEGEMLGMVVANGAFSGGGRCVAPRARLNDGLLDCVIVPVLTLTELSIVLRDLLRAPESRTLENLVYRQLPEVRVTTKEPMQVNLDGEPRHNQETRFRVEPGALRVVPAIPDWFVE